MIYRHRLESTFLDGHRQKKSAAELQKILHIIFIGYIESWASIAPRTKLFHDGVKSSAYKVNCVRIVWQVWNRRSRNQLIRYFDDAGFSRVPISHSSSSVRQRPLVELL
jgi:hypothetical protein